VQFWRFCKKVPEFWPELLKVAVSNGIVYLVQTLVKAIWVEYQE
jgi:hypothetical protein